MLSKIKKKQLSLIVVTLLLIVSSTIFVRANNIEYTNEVEKNSTIFNLYSQEDIYIEDLPPLSVPL
ncbi:MAG: hypothetical protein ACTSSG_00845 [Candidatus Heimdallarchaeaceae archaeon]